MFDHIVTENTRIYIVTDLLLNSFVYAMVILEPFNYIYIRCFSKIKHHLLEIIFLPWSFLFQVRFDNIKNNFTDTEANFRR